MYFYSQTVVVTLAWISSISPFYTSGFAPIRISHSHSFVLSPPLDNVPPPKNHPYEQMMKLEMSTDSTTSTSTTSTSSSSPNLEEGIQTLKKILTREYTTFFDPMYTEYYSPNVTFLDPMTELEGVSSYQTNVDMLASRTLKGKFLFSDAGISLHSVTGGEIDVTDQTVTISDIVTRWTLRVTAKALPWKPTARFSGISVYQVQPTQHADATATATATLPPVWITGQTDYWDSININPNESGSYQQVDKSIAIQDFLGQVKPGSFEAKQSAPELPYELLRRGNGYEVRRYPEHAVVSLPYKRRDEGFGSLGSFTRDMKPLAPAIMKIQKSETLDKTMSWPIVYKSPNGELPIPSSALEKAGQGQWRTMSIQTIPSQVIAVGYFNDASMEPVVRMADRQLRECLKRDGLLPSPTSGHHPVINNDDDEPGLMFAQYDAIFSMGKRRGEVWIELDDDGHPW